MVQKDPRSTGRSRLPYSPPRRSVGKTTIFHAAWTFLVKRTLAFYDRKNKRLLKSSPIGVHLLIPRGMEIDPEKAMVLVRWSQDRSNLWFVDLPAPRESSAYWRVYAPFIEQDWDPVDGPTLNVEWGSMLVFPWNPFMSPEKNFLNACELAGLQGWRLSTIREMEMTGRLHYARNPDGSYNI